MQNKSTRVVLALALVGIAFSVNSARAATGISNLVVTDIDATAATIKFDVSELAMLVIRYGTTTSYGKSQAHPMFMMNHNERLLDLSPGTLYHYQIELTNQDGTVTTIPDHVFTTVVGSSPWVFEESFNGLTPTTPSQDMLPRTFDYVVTHRAHPATPDGVFPNGSYGKFLADHGDACEGGLPMPQHWVHTNHRSNGGSPDPSFFNCNGHMMSSMGQVNGYSVTGFWTKQEFDFANDGVLEWDVNINDGGRHWWEVVITPRDQNQLGEAQDWLPIDETYPKDRIVLSVQSRRLIQVGKGQTPPDGWYVNANDLRQWERDIVPEDPAMTDRRIRRKNRVEFYTNVNGTGNGKIRWGIAKPDGTLDYYEADVPGGFAFTRGIVMFKTHSYTPDKAENYNKYTFHWDNIRFTGPKIPPYENYEATGTLVMSGNGSVPIGTNGTMMINLSHIGANPVLEGQVLGGMVGQNLLSINGRPNIEVRPAVAPSNQPDDCMFGGYRTIRIPLDPSWLKVGENTFKWTVGPRNACAVDWAWDGYSVKALEVQFDGVEGQPAVTIGVPQPGDIVNGTINIVSAVTDPTYAQGVQLRLDGVDLGTEDNASPYIMQWNTASTPDGEHTLVAVLRNNQGQLSLSPPVKFRVMNSRDTTLPEVAITNLREDNAGGLLVLTAAATDNVGVAGVQFRTDESNIGTEDTSAPYSTTVDTTQYPDGYRKFYAYARDAAGNIGYSNEFWVNINNSGPQDTTPPNVWISTPATNAVVSGNAVVIAASATDDIDHNITAVQFKIDGIDVGKEVPYIPYMMTFNSTLLTNGNHTLTAVARDTAGNAATSAPIILRVSNASPVADTMAPAVSFTSISDGDIVNGGQIPLIVSATDNLGIVGVQFRVDGVIVGSEDTAAPYESSWDGDVAAMGAHVLSATARDAAGNSFTRSITVTKMQAGVCVGGQWKAEYFNNESLLGTPALTRCENSAPFKDYGWSKPDPLISEDHFSVRWTATLPFTAGVTTFTSVNDDGARLYVDSVAVISDWNWQGPVTNVAARFLTAGLHHLRYEYFEAGNGAVAQLSWVSASSDAAKPTVGILQPAAGATVSGMVTISGTATDNIGVSRVQFMVDGVVLSTDSAAPFSFAWDSTAASNGNHAVGARSYDAAGNSSATAVNVTVSNVIQVDVTSPTISNVSSGGLQPNAATITWATNENADSQVEYGATLSYGALTPLNVSMTMSHSQNLSGLNAGATYHYRVRSKDAAGNLAISGDFTFATPLTDGVPPAAGILSPAQNAMVSGILTISGTATDNVGVARVQFLLDGVVVSTDSSAPYAHVWFTTGAVNGAHQVSLRSYDAAGNSSSTAVTVTVNNVPPPNCGTINANSFFGCYYNDQTLTNPVLGRTDASLNFIWSTGSPDAALPVDHFSAQWQGNFTFSSGTYAFTATTDDGLRVWIDSVSVLDQWNDQPATVYNFTRLMTPGTHFIKVQYYENTGDAQAVLSWAQQSGPPASTGTNKIVWQGQNWNVTGVNVPWYNWGSDFGGNANGGVSGNLTTLRAAFQQLKDRNIHMVRWWVFPGDPWQITRDGAGMPTGLNNAVFADFDAALQLAADYDLYINFVLFSGPAHVPATWISNSAQRAKVAEVLSPLFSRYAGNSRVMSWEIFNEPEFAMWNNEVNSADTVDLVRQVTDAVHSNSSAMVTIGNASADGIPMWSGVNLDYYSPHWYDYMSSGDYCIRCNDYDHYKTAYGISKPIVIGEFFAGTDTDALQRFEDFYNKGFAGAWAWSLFPGRTSDNMSVDMAAMNTFSSAHSDIGPRSSMVPDITLPAVAITSPAHNSVLSGVVNVTANASDNVGVDRVQFLLDGVVRSTDVAAPYAYVFYSTAVANGAHVLSARAFDAAGNSSATIANVTVNNPVADTTLPTVGVTSPANNASVSGMVAISATANDNVGVVRVEFLVDGAFHSSDIASPYSYAWNSSTASIGVHMLSARAFDAAGNSAIHTVNVTVADTSAPVISINNPVNGSTVAGHVTISAAAMDNVGVNMVQFWIDGVVSPLLNAPPYRFIWNSSTATVGAHTILARAFDAAGNNASHSVDVTVADSVPPQASLASPSAGATLSGTVSISGTATDNAGVSRVQFLVDGIVRSTSVAAPYGYLWNTATETNGTHTLAIRAFDAALNVASQTISVTVGNVVTAPLVSNVSAANIGYSSATISWLTDVNSDSQVEFGTTAGYGSLSSLNPSLVLSHSIQLTGLSMNTVYHYRVRSRDAAGNAGVSGDRTFTTPLFVDVASPTISIVAPSSGAVVSGTVSISGTAADNDTLAKVDMRIDNGAYQLASGLQNWTFALNTLGLSSGTHRVEARATDLSGNVRLASIQINVLNQVLDTVPPSIRFLAPAPNETVISSALLRAGATDNVAVNRVEFFVDGVLRGFVLNAPYEYAWDSSKESNGAHQLRAVAYDAAGNNSAATLEVTVNNPDRTPPVVIIQSPADNAKVRGTVQVTAQITDDRGKISKAELYVDGALKSTLTSEPYHFTFNANAERKGRHQLEVRATDVGGNRGSHQITVSVIKTRISLVHNPLHGRGSASELPLLLVLDSNDLAIADNSFNMTLNLSGNGETVAMSRLTGQPEIFFAQMAQSQADPDSFNASEGRTMPLTVNGQTLDAVVSPNIIVPELGARIRNTSTRAEVIFMPGAIAADAQITIHPEPSSGLLQRSDSLKRHNYISVGDAQEFTFVSDVGMIKARIRLPFTRAHMPAGGSDRQIRIAYYNPATGGWELQPNTNVVDDMVECDVTHFSLYKPVYVAPASTEDQAESYAYPNPVLAGAHPSLRAFIGRVESVSIEIFDITGKKVHSATLQGEPSGIMNDRYFYEYKWSEPKASGVYLAVIKGSGSEGNASTRTRFAVVQ